MNDLTVENITVNGISRTIGTAIVHRATELINADTVPEED
jgi:hypothetical protein